MNNIFLFYGNEELIIKNKIDKLVKSTQCDQFNITSYDLEEVNVALALQDASTLPFMGDNKVVILRNPYFLTTSKVEINHNTKVFSKYLTNPAPYTLLIIDATFLTLDDKKPYVKELLKVAEVSNTKELSAIEAEGWLKRQFEIKGITIKDETVKLFFNNIGKNLLNAKQEVDKLLNYIGERKNITNKDVSDVVTKEIESDVYSLTSAIMEQNRQKIMNIYHDLTKSGKDAFQLFALISRSMRNVCIVNHMLDNNYKQNEIAQALNVSPGRAYYMIKEARGIKKENINKNICRLADLDYKIKSGQVEVTSGLEFLLFGL